METTAMEPIAESRLEPLSDCAYTRRPYADEAMIYKSVDTPQGTALFIVDPWTQRWIIAREPARGLLELCNGKTRLSEIVRRLEARPGAVTPEGGFIGLADQLREARLLWDTKADHHVAGRPVYNECEPIGMHLEITNACNMTCTHCYVSSGKKLPGELTIEEVYRTIDMLPPFSGKRIAISGGEPAVRRDCAEIVEYCAVRCGHDVDLYTNGKRFPEALAQRIRRLNERGGAQVRIQVSLEGATAETNDRVRGAGSFALTLKSLEMFQRVGVHRSVVIFVCLTAHNLHEVDALIELAERFDVSMLVFSQWQRQGEARDTPWATIAPSHEEWVAVGEKLLAYENPRLLLHGNFYGDLHNTVCGRFGLDSELFPKHLYFYNAFPRISPDGRVWADQLWVDDSWVLGNVRDQSLERCFHNPKFYEQLEEMRVRTDHIPECQKCEWRAMCEGGSPGHTYAEYGHMNAKDLFCESRLYWFDRYVRHQVGRAFQT